LSSHACLILQAAVPASLERRPSATPPAADAARTLYLVRPTVVEADTVDSTVPPPRLIATGAGSAPARPSDSVQLPAASVPMLPLSCVGGASALSLLLLAASGEGGGDGDVRAQASADGSVILSFGGSQTAALQITCRLQANLDPLSLSSLVFECSSAMSPPFPLRPHTALAVAAVTSGGPLAPVEWARAFIQRVQQCYAMYHAIIDETRADTERNLYRIEFADSAGSSALTVSILPHSRSGVTLQPLALLIPVTYPHVSPQPCLSAALSHLRAHFLTLMRQHSQPWPVSLMVHSQPLPTHSA
jgi:hypothetical protein